MADDYGDGGGDHDDGGDADDELELAESGNDVVDVVLLLGGDDFYGKGPDDQISL